MDKGLKKRLEENKQSGLKDSIKIFFMENFRKLSMGIQATFDSMVNQDVRIDSDPDFHSLKNINHIDFDLTPTTNSQEGRVWWSEDDKTLNIGTEHSDVTLQVGQEQHIRATNKTGSEIPDGTVVYVTGAIGQRPIINLADADSFDTCDTTIGFTTEDIADNTTGYVTTFGIVRNIDTSGCSAGDILWLSQAAGEFTTTRPTAPSMQIAIGMCLYSHETEGNIFTRITLVPRLSHLSDVYVDSIYDGQLLGWHNANERWEQASAWKDINVGAISLNPIPARNPDVVQFVDEEGTNTGIYTYGFDTNEGVSGVFEIQHDYKEGSDVVFHIHWQGNDTPSGTDKVKWQLTYSLFQDDVTLLPVTTITIESDIDIQYMDYRSDFPTITGTDFKIGDQFIFTLERINATANEYAGDAVTATLGIHYQVDTIGSRQITSK